MEKNLIFSIDLGGTTSKLAIMTLIGSVIKKWEIPTIKEENGKFIVPNIFHSFETTATMLNLQKDQFLGVGMGAPGPVLKDGSISKAVNLGWNHYPLKQELEQTFSLPAYVANDANCAALGEMWQGAGSGLSDLVCVTLGTGVGGGIIVDGHIVNGISGGGGEIGHMTVQHNHGFACNCGKSGCLETVASATGVVNLAMEKLNSEKVTILRDIYEREGKLTAKHVFDIAKEDEIAREVVDQVGYYLGYALGTLSTILNPEAFIISGGVSKAGNILLDAIRKHVDQFAFPPTSKDTKLLLASLGNDAGIFGAGFLVKQQS